MPEPKTQIAEQREYRGLYTLRKAGEIPKFFAAHTLNADLSSSSQIAPIKGYSSFGNQANASDKIVENFRYERGLGLETLLQVRNDGSNTILEYLNPGDDRNSADGEWIPLVTNYDVDGFAGQSFTAFNDTGTDNLLISNGKDNFSRWSGAICRANGAISAGAATITVEKITGDPKTNATDGFGSTGSFVYKDTAGAITTVTYTGKTATTFTGCSGATASADNTGVAEAVDTSTYSAHPKARAILTAHGRLWMGGKDTAPTLLEASAVGDFTDVSVSTAPDDPLNRDFVGEGKILALGAIDEWLIVFKERAVKAYGLQYPSSTTRVPVMRHISGVGIASGKALDLVGDDYIYVSPDGQIRRLSRVAAEDIFNTEDLTNIIRPTIEDFDWSDAAIGYFRKERVLFVAARSDSDQSNNDRVVAIQFSENSQNQPVHNIGILDWFVGDWAEYTESFFFGPSVESQCMKAFDGYNKNGASYRFEYTTRAEHFGSDFEQKHIIYLEVKGKVGAGTTLNLDVLFDENGQTALYEFDISESDADFIVSGVTNPLGVNALGTEPLGGTLTDIDELSFFHVVFAIPHDAYPYNVQANFYTDGEGQRAVVFSHAWHWALANIKPRKLKGVKNA